MHCQNLYEQFGESPVSYEEALKLFAHQLNSSTLFYVESDNFLIRGYATGVASSDMATLAFMDVHSTSQRVGYGARLLKAFEIDLRVKRSQKIVVVPCTDSSRQFFRKHGYNPITSGMYVKNLS